MTTTDTKIAFVTGASTGFGRLTVETLNRAGWRVFGTMRDIAGRNAAVRRELESLGIAVVEMDVTSDVEVERVVAGVLNDAGHIDLVVNNAGTAHFGILEAQTLASVERQFQTNVFGPLRVNRAVLPSMRARKSGLIVQISSVVGRFAMPFAALYGSSKWAIEVLNEGLSYEVAPFGVDVAILEPGAYMTNIYFTTVSADDDERVASYGEIAKYADVVIGKLRDTMTAADAPSPQEVADAVLALAQMEPGTRPLRTVVGENPAVTAINDLVAPIQRRVLEARGLGDLLRPVAPV
jgi:NAD(P)-dependent dehydrogenase (short-subunit alcohol dehydrogenase family)